MATNPLSSALPDTVAAVDLGSNSFHMIVARTHDGELIMQDRLREMVRLAAGLDENRYITDEAAQRALDCLARFGQRLRHLSPGSVRAVGTNTMRSAHNAGQFLAEAERALGHPIEVISGLEEARLIYLGVSQALAADGRRRLVMDIGGGSTELIIGKSFEPLHMESLYMGCVSMSSAYFKGGNITAKAVRRAELAALQELEPHAAHFREQGWEDAIGASGTIRAVDRLVREAGWSDDGITLTSLKRLVDALIKAGRAEKLPLAGLSMHRAPVFAGGVIVLLATFEALAIERMRVSDWALREGLLFDLIGRIRHEDVRDRTVANMAQRYRVQRAHAQRVEQTALDALDQVAAAWSLVGNEYVQALRWAARLHEIGIDIAHAQYHKHGAYVLENADLPGFSRQEQSILAALVRAHRRKFRSDAIESLPAQRAEQTRYLAVVLRLAVLLHRSRNPEAVPQLALKAGKRSLKIKFPDGWLDAQPLTRADLKQEAEFLAQAEIQLSFS